MKNVEGPWIIAYADVEVQETTMIRDDFSKSWKEAIHCFFEHLYHKKVEYVDDWIESCTSIEELRDNSYWRIYYD